MRREPILMHNYWEWSGAPIVEYMPPRKEEFDTDRILDTGPLAAWGGMITWKQWARWYSYVVLP